MDYIEQANILLNSINQNLFNDKILNIKGVKIPNYYLLSPHKWEFCHQIIELYEDYILNDNFFYENKNIKLLPSDIVYDCGANMGLFSAYALATGCITYAFEPNEDLIPYLKLLQYFYPKLYIINKGCYFKSQKLLYGYCDNIGANHFDQYNHANAIIRKKEIEVISLDSFAKGNQEPSFIKMDVEGAEEDILLGCENILKNKPKMAISCYHLNNNPDRVIQIINLLNKDYTVTIKKDKIIFAS